MNEKQRETVRRLLALANDRAATEGERENCRRMLDKIKASVSPQAWTAAVRSAEADPFGQLAEKMRRAGQKPPPEPPHHGKWFRQTDQYRDFQEKLRRQEFMRQTVRGFRSNFADLFAERIRQAHGSMGAAYGEAYPDRGHAGNVAYGRRK
jgi:hypothetical protein